MTTPTTSNTAANQTVHGIPLHNTANVDQQETPALPPLAVDQGLARLRADLRAIITQGSLEEVIRGLTGLTVVRSPVLTAAWFQKGGNSLTQKIEEQFSNPALDNDSFRGQMIEAANTTLNRREPGIFQGTKVKQTATLCIPVAMSHSRIGVLVAVVHHQNESVAQALLICQMAVSHFELWLTGRDRDALAFEIRSAAAAIELLCKTQHCRSIKAACHTIAEELQRLFRCDYVAVGMTRKNSTSTQLIAISSIADFDSTAQQTRLFNAAFDETMINAGPTIYPPASGQANATLAHKALTQQQRCDAAISVPIRNDDETIVGTITILGNHDLTRNQATMNLAAALQHPLGGSLEIVKHAQGGWLRQTGKLLFSKKRAKSRSFVFAGLFLASVVMLIPVPYRIHCQCVAEPVMRRVSVAPFDGLLENTFVEPGDIVERKQVLAKMDGREISFEKAGVIADRNRANKKRDTHMARHEVADEMMADLESMQLQMKETVLSERQNQLEITSPVQGVVLSGSIDRRQNFPVTRGQLLFEIAPLAKLRVELAVPADEIMHVKKGQKVLIRFDGFGTDTIEADLTRIRPNSTVRDDANVFIAEVELDNRDGFLRPGMLGKGRIVANKKRLGWTLFHRPWEKIVTAIGF